LYFLVLIVSINSSADSQGPKKILVVGDSLSAAYNLPVEAGWVSLLDKHYANTEHQLIFINASVSGATTDAGLKILPVALKEHDPDFVIIALGANDGLRGRPIPYITKNLSTLITTSQDAGAKVLLLGVRIPPNYGLGYTEPFFQQYLKLSDKYETALVPFMLEGVAGNQAMMMADRMHPNTEGQKVMLQNVLPYIDALIKNSTE
jgi:acyl-CoA thioesterase-1